MECLWCKSRNVLHNGYCEPCYQATSLFSMGFEGRFEDYERKLDHLDLSHLNGFLLCKKVFVCHFVSPFAN